MVIVIAALTLLCRPQALHAEDRPQASEAAPGDTVTSAGGREYTEEHPLVYEGVWDLWPYSFLNDKGEPEGYNIDLIRLIMKRLNIPYVIKLRPSEEAFNDLKSGKSDLTLGLAVGYHDQYGLYGKNAVTLFTQSVVTPKSKPVQIKTFRDLGKPGMKVIVNHTSMCYHLMKDYGWEENAIPEKDIREVIQRVSATEEGQIVWNTLTLKWLMRRYLIDNLQMTPVNMPHGEYKFMSNDQHLLDLLDEELTKLNATEELKPLQDKWFYPERHNPGIPTWFWYALGVGVLLLLIFSVYAISYRLQNRKITRANLKLNRRLALILQTSHVRLWTYDILNNQFSWRNDNGQVAYTYTMDEFAQRYSPEDFNQLKAALDKLAATELKDSGEEEELTLTLKAKDSEDGDNELRDFVIVLSVLRRDQEGKPTVIIGTKKDVTKELEQKRLDDERTLRYWSIFYTPILGIMLFDKDGLLTNINPKACEMYDIDSDTILERKGVTINDFFDTGIEDLTQLDGFHATQYIDLDSIPIEHLHMPDVKRHGKLCFEFRLMTINDDAGNLMGVFAFCRDMSDTIKGIEQYNLETARLKAVKKTLAEYDHDIDSVLHESDVRLATYSPKSHTLTVYRSVYEVQHKLTQTRCMTLVDERSQKLAMRILNDMDDCENTEIKVNIRTTLRIKGGKRLNVQFCLMPQLDKDGQVTEYLGLLRDISEFSSVEHEMAIQTAKVQEVEDTKSKFVKNMVQEIRKPMNNVLNYVGQLQDKVASANEAQLSDGIQENADYLLHLIDNILYLSRLEAHMVEFAPRPNNFAEVFESHCRTGWMKYQNPDTNYVVESPYTQLEVNIDSDNLGHAIKQVCANAAQHTKSGSVKARYDYIGRRLIISIDDTGEGIPQDELERLNQINADNVQSSKGLGLAITKEIVSQMNGTFEINSEEGSGTTVYISIPCHATAIKRKKIV